MKGARAAHALLAIVLGASVLGCETEADRRKERLDRLAQVIDARLSAAELPTIPHGERWTPADVRVIVGEHIAVDRAANTLELFGADPEAYAESGWPIPEPGPRVLELPNGRLPASAVSARGTLPALAEALQPPPPAGQMTEPGRGRDGPPHRGPLDLTVGSEIPYRTFAPVLRTVVRERYAPRLVFPGPREVLQLPVHLPPVVGGCRSVSCIRALAERRAMPEGSDEESNPEEPARLDLTIAIGEDGVNVFGSGGVLARGCQRIREIGDESNTVPRRSGTLDRAALADCLRSVDEVYSDEDVVLIQPEPSILFNEVAMVASLAYAEGRFPELLFAEPE